MNKKHTNKLYCFSPPVMAATFIIEICLLVYAVLSRGLKTTLHKITAATLLCLAVFQLAEYNVCGRFNIDALTWSRIGFVVITILPPLGLHLVHILAGLKQRFIVWTGYLAAASWVYIFALSPYAFQSHQCAGNYAIFQLAHGIGGMYFFYYYALMFVAVIMAWRALSRATKYQAQALKALIAGYGFFIVPTTIVNTLRPETLKGIPSIMCGFAVLFAITLVFVIMPNGEKATKKLTKHKQ